MGTGIDLSIRELAEAVATATGYGGRIEWDTSKPDGTPKKQLDVSRLARLGGLRGSPWRKAWRARWRSFAPSSAGVGSAPMRLSF